MARHKDNARYEHSEVVKLEVTVEIAYSKPEGRADALEAASQIITGCSCGGCGRNGSYNAVVLKRAVKVKKARKTT